MNVLQLRDKLNTLIEQGKGEYRIYDMCEDVYEVENIEEGKIYTTTHLAHINNIRENFISLNFPNYEEYFLKLNPQAKFEKMVIRIW